MSSRRESWHSILDPEEMRDVIDKPSGYAHMVPALVAGVREVWSERLMNPEKLPESLAQVLNEGSSLPELEEWACPKTCLRVLQASDGDFAFARKKLVKAVEFRVRDRQLLSSHSCAISSDARVIGWDKEDRPAVYICGRSQKKPIREAMPQMLLALEAAVKLGTSRGEFILIMDMHGFSGKYNMDLAAIKVLVSTLGAVYVDRMHSISIIDFSVVAQGFWSLAKSIITERTRKKISFLSQYSAREELRKKLATPTFERVVSSFEINRNKSSTESERRAHAMRTAISDFPFSSDCSHQ